MKKGDYPTQNLKDVWKWQLLSHLKQMCHICIEY